MAAAAAGAAAAEGAASLWRLVTILREDCSSDSALSNVLLYCSTRFCSAARRPAPPRPVVSRGADGDVVVLCWSAARSS